jgi:hypothetical protein
MLQFGLKKQRVKLEEKYVVPVMTILADRGLGYGARVEFNKAASEFLKLGEESSVGFVEYRDKILIFDVSHLTIADSNRVTKGKDKSFSNKPTRDKLIKLLNLNKDINNEIYLNPLAHLVINTDLQQLINTNELDINTACYLLPIVETFEIAEEMVTDPEVEELVSNNPYAL